MIKFYSAKLFAKKIRGLVGWAKDLVSERERERETEMWFVSELIRSLIN